MMFQVVSAGTSPLMLVALILIGLLMGAGVMGAFVYTYGPEGIIFGLARFRGRKVGIECVGNRVSFSEWKPKNIDSYLLEAGKMLKEKRNRFDGKALPYNANLITMTGKAKAVDTIMFYDDQLSPVRPVDAKIVEALFQHINKDNKYPMLSRMDKRRVRTLIELSEAELDDALTFDVRLDRKKYPKTNEGETEYLMAVKGAKDALKKEINVLHEDLPSIRIESGPVVMEYLSTNNTQLRARLGSIYKTDTELSEQKKKEDRDFMLKVGMIIIGIIAASGVAVFVISKATGG